MANYINALNGGIPKIFGNGLLGTAVTGLGRITALMPTMIATIMVGELALRGLQNILRGIGLEPKDDSWISQAGKKILEHGARPYEKTNSKTLALQALAFTAIGIVGSESMRVLGGEVPAIYNNVLAFMGPVRLSNQSYLEGVTTTLNALGLRRFV